MPVSLYDPYAGIGTQNPFSGAGVNMGNEFQVGYDCSALGIGVWGAASTVDVGIYDVTNSTWVYSNTAPSFVTTPAGWWYHQITGPAPLLVGNTYQAVAFFPSGVTWFYDCNAPAAGPGLVWVKSPGGAAFESAGSSLANPTGYVTNRTHPISVTTDLVSPIDPQAPGGTSTPGDVANAFVAWLADTGDNTHRYNNTVPGLPDITNRNVLDVAAGINVAGGASGATIGGIAAWVWANRDALKWGYDQLRGHFAATPDATYPEIDTNVLTLLSRTGSLEDDMTLVLAALTNIQDDVAKILNPPPTSASWTLLDETDFDTNLEWGQEADVYTVAFSSLGSNTVNTVIGATDVSYRLAWWAPWNGSASRNRRFVDFPVAQLYDGGVRMPGVVLHSPAGAAGHIQAWTIG